MGAAMSEKIHRLHVIVRGRVQGVGFRHNTVQRALQIGELRGWVRNRHDGAVEVMAEGTRARLEMLLHYLERGPSAAYVRNLETTWLEARGDLEPFTVRF